jgi:hypothetical protein
MILPLLQLVRKLQTTAEWYRWCIEVGELVEQRDKLFNHPHSLGEKWEQGLIAYYQEQIDHLRANEPPKKGVAH